MNKKFNLLYNLNFFFYFAMFASMFSYVSVYLLDKGYANSTIGTVLAITGIFTIFLQTGTAQFLDKHPSFRLQNALSIYVLLIVTGTIFLLFFSTSPLLLFFIVLVFSLAQASETLINALAFIFEKFGVHINYGFGRGMGSLAFALTTMVVGNVVNRTSADIIPFFYLLFSFCLLLGVRAFRHPKEDETPPASTLVRNESSGKSIFEFIQQYKRLLFVMIGVGCLMFMHLLINNFFIQIILPIGGNSATMGNAIFLGAILELPAMFNYKQIEKRSSASTLLKVSAVFFVVKHFLTFFATNMWMIYLAQAVQIGAFALMYPAGVSYVYAMVSERDLVKGQSLFTSAIALSSIAGNFVGGLLLDGIGVSETLFIGVVVTVIGAGIIFLAANKPSGAH